jgi:hypothetical protein
VKGAGKRLSDCLQVMYANIDIFLSQLTGAGVNDPRRVTKRYQKNFHDGGRVFHVD